VQNHHANTEVTRREVDMFDELHEPPYNFE